MQKKKKNPRYCDVVKPKFHAKKIKSESFMHTTVLAPVQQFFNEEKEQNKRWIIREQEPFQICPSSNTRQMKS